MTRDALADRAAPPDLEFRYPDCPLCCKEVGGDGGGFWCENCGTTWSRDGQDGEWNDPDAAQCASTVQPFRDAGYPNIASDVFRCLLADDHGGKHNNPEWTEWGDDSPYLVTVEGGTDED